MTGARIFTPENRLAKVLQSPSAPTAEELVAAAEARVADLERPIRAFIAGKLDEILPYAALDDGALFTRCGELGRLAMQVAEVAGAGRMGAVGEIARGVLAMIDSQARSGVWHSDALRQHLHSLGLIGRLGGTPAAQAEVLSGLAELRQAIGVVD